MRPKVARAQALPPHIVEQLNKRNEEDRKKVIKEQIDSISKWCDPRYKHIVEQFKYDQHIIEELDYIRVMYDRKRLTPSQRIRVRERITTLIQNNKLTTVQLDFFLSVLAYYDCL